MSWVGIGTAIGLVIDMPILLWSLADSLAPDVNVDHLPLGFHSSLLTTPDDGVATNCPSHLVCDWWRHSMELAQGGIFHFDTLDECLDRHWQYMYCDH